MATPPAATERPATIHDIAALCGVAASTVSRALSTPERVNIRTRQRIEEAAAQLRYIPNSQAKALSSGRTGAVGVLVPDITNPFYFDLIRGTQLQLKAAGYTQLLVDTEESDEVEASTMEQLRKTADGIVVTASRLSDDALLAAAAKMPMVTINRDVAGIPAVVIDTPSATTQALDHLISLGHTSIAYVAGPLTSQSSARRWTSLSEAAGERGVEVRSLGPLAPTTQSGAVAADAAVHSGVTACIAFNDLIAIGMLQRLQARGIRVPEDMSIVGCDDIFGADFCNPPLTTMASPIEQAGRVAHADVLLAETLLDPAVLDVVPLQVFVPEGQRARRHRVDRRLNLPRSLPSRHPLVGKGRHHGAHLGVRVGVIQVVVRVPAVEQHGLLDEPLAHHFRQEVNVLLRTRRTKRDVVQAFHEIRHVSSPACFPRLRRQH